MNEERAEEFGQYDQLKAFIGGVQDDWQIMVYNGAYGLSLLDLLSGNSAQPQVQQPQQSAGGGLLSALFNLLGDN